MSFANLNRVKQKLELTVPDFENRTDYDKQLERLMPVAHAKVRFVVEQEEGGELPQFLELFAPGTPTDPINVASMVNENRRLRFRLLGADAFASDSLTFTITGIIDGIEITEDVEFTEDGELVSVNAFESIDNDIAVANIPGTPGTIQVLEDVDPTLSDAEDLLTACLFLGESADRFAKEDEPPEFESWCARAKKMVKDWVEQNTKTTTVRRPLFLRASS